MKSEVWRMYVRMDGRTDRHEVWSSELDDHGHFSEIIIYTYLKYHNKYDGIEKWISTEYQSIIDKTSSVIFHSNGLDLFNREVVKISMKLDLYRAAKGLRHPNKANLLNLK